MQDFLRKNIFFLVPFLLWLLLGGLALCIFSQDQLFFFINQGFISTFSDYFFYAMSGYGRGDFTAVVLLLLLGFAYYRNWRYFFLGSAYGIATPLVSNGLKHFYNCPRPPVVYGLSRVHTPGLIEVLYNHSFPSGHTMAAYGLSALLTFLLPEKYSKLGVVFFVFAFFAGISRIYLGVHFFKDVYVGSLLGCSLALVLCIMVDIIFKKSHEK